MTLTALGQQVVSSSLALTGRTTLDAGRRLGQLLATWLVVRTLIWTAVTYFACRNAPLDVVEMLYWGREWQWGYGKHPPLPAWLAEMAWWLAGGRVDGVYCLGYALLAITIWAVWRLARLMVPPRTAFIAALSLEGVLFYTYWGYEYNNNVALTAFWALTTLFLYRACRRGRLRDWLATGLCAGLGLLSKYSLAFLLVPMLLWMVLQPRAAQHWRRPGPYVAVAIMLLLVLPHLAWVSSHDWLTVTYASNRAGKVTFQLGARFLNPLSFLGYQAAYVLPVLIALGWCLRCDVQRGWKWLAHRVRRSGPRKSCDCTGEARRFAESEASFAGSYLLAVGIGPLVLHLVVAMAAGARLCGAWGTPLWTLLGLLLLIRQPLWVNRRPWLAPSFIICNFGALAVLLAQPALIQAGWFAPLRCDFPGPALAAQVDRLWRDQYHDSLPNVAGDNWLAGTISIYAPDRPRMSVSADPADTAPWCRYAAEEDDAHFRNSGGIVVWNAGSLGATLPRTLALRFPNAGSASVIFLGDRFALVGLVIVPPIRRNEP